MLIVGPNGALPDPSLFFVVVVENLLHFKHQTEMNQCINLPLEFGYIAKFNWTLIMIIKEREKKIIRQNSFPLPRVKQNQTHDEMKRKIRTFGGVCVFISFDFIPEQRARKKRI